MEKRSGRFILHSVWQWLTHPVEHIQDPLERQFSHWMMRLTLVMGAIVIVTNLIIGNVFGYSMPFFQKPSLLIILVMLMGIGIMYSMSRYGHAAQAGYLACYFFSAMTVWYAIPTDGSPNYQVLSYLVLILVYSIFFLGQRASLAILAFQTSLVLSLPLLESSITYPDVIGVLMFILVIAVLVSLIANYYKQLEENRQQVVQDSEIQYRSIFNSSVYVNMIHDGERVLLCNDAVARLLGWDHAEELVGVHFRDFIHPDDFEMVRARANQRLQGMGQPPERYTHRVIRKDGTVRWVDSQSKVIRFRGNPATLVNAIDVTEQQYFTEIIQRSHAFETIITSISTNFINLESDHLEQGIQEALKEIGEFAQADHAYVILVEGPDNTWFTTAHEWCAVGIPSQQAHFFQQAADGQYRRSIQNLSAGQVVNVTNVAKLGDSWPNDAVAHRTGLQAFIEVPMVYRGVTLGVLGCDSITAPRVWPDDIASMLQIVAEIFASAVQRQRAEQTLKERNQMLEVLNQLGAMAVTTLELPTLLREAARLIGQALHLTSAYISNFHAPSSHSHVLADYYSEAASDLEKISDVGTTYRDHRYEFYQAPQLRQRPFLHVLLHATDTALNPIDVSHFTQYGGQTILNAPLFVKGKRIGSIELWDSRYIRNFTAEELALMESFFAQTALLFDRTQVYHALQSSQEHNTRLLNALPDLVFRQNRTGLFLEATYSNPQDWAFNCQEWVGKLPRQVLSSIAADLFMDTIDVALVTDRVQIFEFDFSRDHETFTYEVRVIKTADDEVLTFIRNITERKQSTQRQLELTVERERVLILQDFISYASHDLRTPITNVKSRLYLLSKIDDREKRQRHIEVMDNELGRLTNLIEDLLTMSQLDSGIMNTTMRIVYINSMLRELAESIQPTTKQKEIEMIFALDEADLSILGDSSALGRMFINLMANAANYTPQGGQITLRSYTKGGGVVVEVQDTGIGIAEEDMPHIFDRFYRADKARNSDSGGTGLGLAIVKKIVELHEGRVEVLSELNQGSTFRVWLPDVRTTMQGSLGQ